MVETGPSLAASGRRDTGAIMRSLESTARYALQWGLTNVIYALIVAEFAAGTDMDKITEEIQQVADNLKEEREREQA